MKKYIIIIIAVVTLVALGLFYFLNQTEKTTNKDRSGTTETAKKDVREVVWRQLSEKQKSEIVGTWEDGKVSKTTLSEGNAISRVGDKSYVGQGVYLINFPSKLNATIGDVIIYADVKTYNIIGYGLRD
ncbi:MAG TPA: hypothetical protein PLZ58_01810 [Candidatus Saccharibacteria bacterium]|nr:hypothetical protein [Candidatus Saccharibacteria bacterium]HRQ07312.1 hypothetical protein [Candidatus Saccharibacteria bacterium]